MLKAMESSYRSPGIVSVLYIQTVAICPRLFRTEGFLRMKGTIMSFYFSLYLS